MAAVVERRTSLPFEIASIPLGVVMLIVYEALSVR